MSLQSAVSEYVRLSGRESDEGVRPIVEEVFSLLESMYGPGLPQWGMAKSLIKDVLSMREPRADLPALAEAVVRLIVEAECFAQAAGIDTEPVLDIVMREGGMRSDVKVAIEEEISGQALKPKGKACVSCGKPLGDVIYKDEALTVEACSYDCLTAADTEFPH